MGKDVAGHCPECSYRRRDAIESRHRLVIFSPAVWESGKWILFEPSLWVVNARTRQQTRGKYSGRSPCAPERPGKAVHLSVWDASAYQSTGTRIPHRNGGRPESVDRYRLSIKPFQSKTVYSLVSRHPGRLCVAKIDFNLPSACRYRFRDLQPFRSRPLRRQRLVPSCQAFRAAAAL